MNTMIKRILQITLIFYLIVTAYTLYVLLLAPDEKKNVHQDQGVLGNAEIKKPKPKPVIPDHQDVFAKVPIQAKNSTYSIEIWSKVGLGSYTWEHILNGKLESRLDGIWFYGELQMHNLKFRMRDGDGVQPDKVPQDIENVMLILNGRAPDKEEYTRYWLDYLGSYSQLRRVVLMLIGNEQCQNDWVLPYMKSRGGPVDRLFIVYDTLIVNGDDIMQWPLGVATYRGFPKIEINQLNLRSPRKHRCNFLGTMYPNSSREVLLKVINENNLQDYCYFKTRQQWEPDESEASLQAYINVILQSDLTLSPVGMNVECYRIYEACALGSVPVVEDITTKGDCSPNPLRLLKKLGAPFIFIKDWKELPRIMEAEMKMSVDEIVDRRRRLVAWYETFKYKMKDILLGKIGEVFKEDALR
ncbi:ribitol-5-phosphate xylosyltransferase 1-like isoform X1 [Lytechinus variegatus]|uniref:ribitol-5-phosphate xylosyltransferase 1-like isoform X1 n=1 Tax=Lytechinus variegatus TaxID=7654 RepID=UPI001BB1093E|nr:ribitol-5-phosphate xylosyltransferase 1-like isoform X1 [Lytechinus variegatus]